jgi:hypothetical protein
MGLTKKDAAKAHPISLGPRISGPSRKWCVSGEESAKWFGILERS